MNVKEKLIERIKQGNYKKVAIFGHTSADPDSLASVFGMEFIIKQLHPEVTIDVLVDGISKHTTELVNYYDHPLKTETKGTYDLIVIVDVNVLPQMGIFQELILKHDKQAIILIDHHTTTNFAVNSTSLAYIDEERTSVAEIILEIMFELSLVPPKPLLNILLSGIIYDSRRFYSLNERTLKLLEKIFDLEVDYDLAISLIQKNLEKSERIARLKSASRLKYEKINDWIIAWSKVGSHEGSAARSLLDIGADVAFIYSQRKGETRLSVRATTNFHQSTNIHFGRDIMKKLSEKFKGDGGGHSTAAALNIPEAIKEETLMISTFVILKKNMENSR